MNLEAVIFDWDGVVIDSKDQHEKSWFLLARELGRPFTHEDFQAGFGKRNQDILVELYGWAEAGDSETIARLGERKEELYRELCRVDGLEPLPGVRDLLDALEQAGIPASVGSSTPRKNLEFCVELLGLDGRFAALTSGEDVERGKPAPDCFELAARRVGATPECCVVLEDTPAGLQAGRAARMGTVGVTGTHPRARLEPEADRVVDSLTELDPVGLASLRRQA